MWRSDDSTVASMPGVGIRVAKWTHGAHSDCPCPNGNRPRVAASVSLGLPTQTDRAISTAPVMGSLNTMTMRLLMGRQRGVSRTSWTSASDCSPALGAPWRSITSAGGGDLCSSIALTVLRAGPALIRGRVFRHCSIRLSRSRCRPWPCGRLSRPRTTTAAPSRPGPIGGRCAQPTHPRWPRVGRQDPRRFPCSL